MPQTNSMAGEPVCSECGYVLTGLTESSKCPECGRPLVEVLTRGGIWGRRSQSKTTMFGLPLVSVAFGPAPGERIGHARGIFAFGDKATGWVAVGGHARGIVAVGGMAIGIFAMGGMSVGLVTAMGGMAVGGLAWGGLAVGLLASGGLCVGWVASGGLPIGWHAIGGAPIGFHVAGPGRSDPVAMDMMQRFSWFFGGPRFGLMTMLGPMLANTVINIAATICIGLLTIAGHRIGRSKDSNDENPIASAADEGGE